LLSAHGGNNMKLDIQQQASVEDIINGMKCPRDFQCLSPPEVVTIGLFVCKQAEHSDAVAGDLRFVLVLRYAEVFLSPEVPHPLRAFYA